MNSLYPLFSHFFKGIGYRSILPDHMDAEGVDSRTAPFCFPFEIAHGYFLNLIGKKPDHLFLPHIQGFEVENGYQPSKVCPLVQGEPFVLAPTFEKQIGDIPVHKPFLQPNKGIDAARKQFIRLGRELGATAAEARRAFNRAWQVQKEMEAAMRNHGRAVLQALDSDPTRIGIVLFGRPYNAFTQVANKGIPHKFATRGCTIIPVDFLDLKDIAPWDHMYWSMGQLILKGAQAVKAHPRLFGVYITSFSCGPDSFIVGFLRNIFGRKPSLTLELDNHTADAGLETRIEAFLDIVDRHRLIGQVAGERKPGQAASSELTGTKLTLTTSSGERVTLHDPRVKLVFPSMNQWLIRAFASVCRRTGVRAEALPAMTEEDLKTGKGNTLCKECLPMQLTTGALLNYIDRRDDNEITVYFMPTGQGPCRFGQYRVYMQQMIERRGIRDVTFMSLSSEDNYAGLGSEFVGLGWYAAILADCFHNIRNLMLVNATDPASATKRLEDMFSIILEEMEKAGRMGLHAALATRLRFVNGFIIPATWWITG
jgi:predicted nucleotide-binding protein (sugar kinase/HSP70/actin superfamily)